jgi:HD-GYP domain-containing protein (c-di-GMP phosphodiesterase class II)
MGAEDRMPAPSRLADLLAGLSLVSDLGFAMPPESAMRRCVVATLLAQRIGLDRSEVADAYYVALLAHIGCVGFAHETAVAYGDEMAVNSAVSGVDLGGPPVGGEPAGIDPDFGRRFATATCEVGGETARRLGLGEGVQRGVREVVEAWDGSVGARGLRGSEISLVARVVAVAAVAALHDALGGPARAASALGGQSGGELDPEIVAAFLDGQADLLGELADRDPHELVLAIEPAPVRLFESSRLPEVAAAIGDVADLKSAYSLGHSGGVARLAVAAGTQARLGDERVTILEVAALLHDVGRVGISNAIWERPGPLTHAQWEQVRLHAYHTERILGGVDVLGPAAAIAGRHHERLDATGYHRGDAARDIPAEARILAAADAFDALVHERPHRPARSAEEAAAELRRDVAAGRLDDDAVEAVVSAAGVAPARSARRERPAGLSAREVEVLRLVARGLANREIAERLVVSPRTAEHHVQHIYAKIGVSSRAAAALFAMEHSLLE